jgi:putative ubiquitin-RnfH superfamily antitoxin RatB of RatAB toxin-antitoxin module
MENAEPIEVEVAYARPDAQAIFKLKVRAGATAEEAIRLSGILRGFPEIDLAVHKVGIFGRLSTLNAPLKPGDRVEIYRPLIADPKEIRRQRSRCEGEE